MPRIFAVSDLITCSRCGAVVNPQHHTCYAYKMATEEAFDEIQAGYGDWQTIYAVSANQAVFKFVEQVDAGGDYPFAEGTFDKVWLLKPGTEDIRMFNVSAEPSVEYHIQEHPDG